MRAERPARSRAVAAAGLALAGLGAGLLVARCGGAATEQRALSPAEGGPEVPASGLPESRGLPPIASTVAPRTTEGERAALSTQSAVDVIVRSGGAPVEGVPVALALFDDHAYLFDGTDFDAMGLVDALLQRSFGSEWVAWASRLWRTDEDGRVRIEFPAGHRGAHRFVALADAPLLGDVRAEADGFPHEPLEIELPPCGSIGVRVRSSDRELLRAARRVRAFLVDGLAFETASLRDASAVLPRVPLRTRLRLRAEDALGRPCSLAREVEGPSAPGGRVAIELELVPPPLVSGRAVDERGAPLARLELRARDARPTSRFERANASPEKIDTDDDGRFELALLEPFSPVDGELHLVAGSGLELDASHPRGTARVAVPPEIGLGARLELGDVVFPTEPLAVAGRVLDETGEPAARARIRVFAHTDSPRLVQLARDLPVDAQGRFALYVRTLPAELLVEARLPGREPLRALHVPAGTDDLELVVAPAGR